MNYEEFFNDLKNIEGRVTKSVPLAAAEGVAERARETVPVATGALRDSIHVAKAENEAMVVADTPYAAIVEFKTGFMRMASETVDINKIREGVENDLSN